MGDDAEQMLADEEMAAFLKMKYVVDSGRQGKVSFKFETWLCRVDFGLCLPRCCPDVLPVLPDFHLSEHNRADSGGTTQLKPTLCHPIGPDSGVA